MIKARCFYETKNNICLQCHQSLGSCSCKKSDPFLLINMRNGRNAGSTCDTCCKSNMDCKCFDLPKRKEKPMEKPLTIEQRVQKIVTEIKNSTNLDEFKKAENNFVRESLNFPSSVNTKIATIAREQCEKLMENIKF